MIHKWVKGATKSMAESSALTHLFADELLPQELAGLEHVGDVVQRTEALVFVLALFLKRAKEKETFRLQQDFNFGFGVLRIRLLTGAPRHKASVL